MPRQDSVYDKPEKFGLTLMGTMFWTDEDFAFDRTAAFRDADGTLYWVSDAGASGDTPFEEVTGMWMLSTGTLHELMAELDKRLDRMRSTRWFSSVDVSYAEDQRVGLFEILKAGV